MAAHSIFGLRRRQEHHSMRVEDFSFGKNETGASYIVYAEIITNKAKWPTLKWSATVTKNVCNTV